MGTLVSLNVAPMYAIVNEHEDIREDQSEGAGAGAWKRSGR